MDGRISSTPWRPARRCSWPLSGHRRWRQAGEFRPGGLLPPGLPAGTVLGLFTLFIIGVGVKAAIMPLHGWLPAAMVAPTPVSALLHAVAVVKAGAFGCLRVGGVLCSG